MAYDKTWRPGKSYFSRKVALAKLAREAPQPKSDKLLVEEFLRERGVTSCEPGAPTPWGMVPPRKKRKPA